ncbi:hypothetical protein GIB67_012441 [Kingdonia uniflora]|uniref:Uncharacterized protein n=1 Tax=Kingdonia uniflora TaxID=39325 RepID=A0A7J7N4K4_9MAGN|nr:hypothetical protein GIB67_012441 [Kingdonia uniflora]
MVPSQNSQNLFLIFVQVKGCPPQKFKPLVNDVLQSNKSFETMRIDAPFSNEPSIPQSNIHRSNKPMLTNVPQSNEPFETIPTDVLLLDKPYIPQSIKCSSLK